MKRKINIKKILSTIFTIFYIFSTIYILYAIALYKSIETPIRILGGATLVVLAMLLWVLLLKFERYKKPTAFIILIVISLLYCLGTSYGAMKITSIYNKIANISSSKKVEKLSASIITTSKSTVTKPSDIKNSKVGIINDKDDYEGYTIGTKIVAEQKIVNTVRYNGYLEMINDLLNNEIQYAIVPTNYENMLASSEGLEDIGQKTKIIYTKEEKKETKIENKNTKKLDEPFTLLIMGVDTVSDGFSGGFNGDALILVTFNPKTTSATILSIPRDTYMPISCMNGRKNKITNAGWRGQECIFNSIQDYFGIKIDYHIKINFNGVVGLVNALGGVEVDVPYSFCEQNSRRQWGKNTVFVKSGKQVLNGEQALAFARHRKVTQYMVSYCGAEYTKNAGYWNDFTRGQNQQIIINAMMKKLKNMNSFSDIEKILDTISKNIETDISTDNILSLYNLAKDSLVKSTNDEAISMQKLYLSGGDARIYDYSFITNSGSKLSLYNYIPYKESKDAVVNAMKENLELKSTTIVKTFSFSIKDKYEEKVIGKNVGSQIDLVLVPNFVGKNVSEAESFAAGNDAKINIIEVEGTKGQFVGQVISQDIPATTDLEMIPSPKTITLKVVSSIASTPEPEPEPEPEQQPTEPTEPTQEENNN